CSRDLPIATTGNSYGFDSW
nr:immunoglobulin heavy chain junction region [Macaca mulatta]MOV88182.1 immunoglobulin heavy chain junction region [Macaca mulatta]MOV88962.1 immunoglobulin heavy chain junction region [Macaca mulatta]MOV88996.1 immunoglobulin heavy chain junction region [Macaca mulatta]MOV89720.1 immunoglobulin heavy chain junction region [Macaca mulatta]